MQKPRLAGCLALGIVVLLSGCTPAGGGSAPVPAGLSFNDALVAESASFEPARGYRAVAEEAWGRGDPARSPASDVPPAVVAVGSAAGSRWRLAADCVIRFDDQPDALAASESAPFPTWRLAADECHGHAGFWQQSGARLFWWMGLPGGWSAEHYAEWRDDTIMVVRRYALRRTGSRAWRADRSTMAKLRASRVVPAPAPAVRPGYSVTRALRAVGEADWATRPGAGTARSLAGTRWRDPSGCVLNFTGTVLAAARPGQRLTRSLESTACDGLRGSWQQQGKRVFWRVNLDSLQARETYADITGDSLMRTREYELRREPGRAAWQATWDPQRSRVLMRVRR